MSPSERAAVDQAHRQFGEPTATPKPRAGEHTKGPWHIENHFVVRSELNVVATMLGSMHIDGDNARRIVACVNALEGYPTSILEEAGAASLFAPGVAIKEIEILRERDRDLVEALAALIDGYSKWTTRQSNAGEWLETQSKAKAVLAKHGR